jgi:hypothetical protein
MEIGYLKKQRHSSLTRVLICSAKCDQKPQFRTLANLKPSQKIASDHGPIILPIKFHVGSDIITTRALALADSGTSESFVDENFVRNSGISTVKNFSL